ncbi:MAG: phosphate acetyltransferase [candidate division Zixibacteria bacterium]|nr:phosphate acetyltransferase [candidate division Zixibacteria bacterium]
MSILEKLQDKAKSLKKRVVYPEGEEERTIIAAKKVVADAIAAVTLIGNSDEISALAGKHGLDLEQCRVIDPDSSDLIGEFTDEFFELRKTKGISRDEAQTTIRQPLYWGAMMVRKGLADGSVAGAINTTGDVIRAGIHVVGLAPGISTVSSFFMMVVPEFLGEPNKVFFFADGAVVPNPTSDQLGAIAVSTARAYKVLIDEEPRVAMLSFSTKGSARHRMIDKVTAGLAAAREIDPDLIIDGELQVDAAIIPKIQEKKAPDSPVAGKANVLVFPDLDAGNIAYKIVQRLAKAEAIGPIVQGLAHPVNDLSRGCSADDIVNVTAIAMIMSTL